MPRQIILFNGPPRSGKDTAGEFLREYSNEDSPIEIMKFANAVKNMTHGALGFGHGDPDLFEEVKDSPDVEGLMGATPRQAYIQMSEGFMKPLLGEAVFGRLLVADIEASTFSNDTIVVTDSGFMPEARVLVEEYGAANITLVQMHRPGYDFEGDSRGYIDLSEFGILTETIRADTVMGIHEQLREKFPDLLGPVEYTFGVDLPVRDSEGDLAGSQHTPIAKTVHDLEHAEAIFSTLSNTKYRGLTVHLFIDGQPLRSARVTS